MHKSTRSKIYILLHGAWHGAWCWDRILPILKKSGHTVFAPDLPGHGKDQTDIASITLKSYVDSVATLINAQPTSVILVGHSMSGVVITQVAELIPDRIEKLIYLTAFVPSDKGNLVQEESLAKKPSVAKEIVIDEENNTISLKLSTLIRSYFYNTCSDQDATLALLNLQKQPLRPFLDPVNITNNRFGSIPKLYIECLKDAAIYIEDQRRMHAKLHCEIRSLNTDHSPFISAPLALAKTLL